MASFLRKIFVPLEKRVQQDALQALGAQTNASSVFRAHHARASAPRVHKRILALKNF